VDAGQPDDAMFQGAGGGARMASRHSLLIRPAKIVCGVRELPCVIRDVSEIGISIRSFVPLPDADEFHIEMLTGERFAVEPIWAEHLAAGFRFAEPVDLDLIITGKGRHPSRPVRLTLQVPALLKTDGISYPVVVGNMSQHGAQIECKTQLAIHQKVQIKSDCVPKIDAVVRWRRGNFYGLVFEQTFQLKELSDVVVRIHGSFAFLKAGAAMAQG
jgi:hypothetical protein